jgi:hypothetical protein
LSFSREKFHTENKLLFIGALGAFFPAAARYRASTFAM